MKTLRNINTEHIRATFIRNRNDGNMEDLCPLCSNNGRKRSVKLFQVNLQEAVRICEEDECPWPFGYEGFTFQPRIVGKTWSYYWDDYSSKPKETLSPLSTKQQQHPHTKPCSTPVIPQLSLANHLQTNITFDNEEEQQKTSDHNILAASQDKPKNEEFQKNSTELSNTSIKTSFETICIEEDIKEVSDETITLKRNIKASSKLPIDRSPSAQPGKLLLEACNEVIEVESSVNTTKVNIEHLPPVNLSHEISLHQKATANLLENSERVDSRKSSAKRSLTSGKQYAKFSFGSIKKTLGSNNDRGDGDYSKKISPRQKTVSNGNGGKLDGPTGSSSELVKSCEGLSEDSWIKTDSVNLDTVLDDFLNGSCGDGKDVNDDWINSLLI